MKPDMRFKPIAYAPSDVPLRTSTANGSAILSPLISSAIRRLAGCYVPRCSPYVQ